MYADAAYSDDGQSRPARGAWIEIQIVLADSLIASSRAPHGARGLKLFGLHLDDLKP